MPSSVPAYVNLADVYRVLGRDAEGESVLTRGAESRAAERRPALFARAGADAPQARRHGAEGILSRAGLEPGNARFAYVNAIALHSSGKADAAIAQLRKALEMHPVDGDIISALANFYRQRGDSVQATRYTDRLRKLSVSR